VADHQLDHIADGDLAHRVGGDPLAVAQDGHPVGDHRQLVQAVADVDDPHLVLAQAPDHLEQGVDLPVGQDRARLVQDQDLGVVGEGLGDRHQLLLPHRDVGDADVGQGGVQPQPVQQLVELGPLGRPVDQHPSGQLAADEDVLGHRQLAEQLRLLVDGGDAGVESGRGVAPAEASAVHLDGALVGGLGPGDDLDEGGLARAVLPDQRVHLPGTDVEVDTAQRLDAAVALADAGQAQQRLGFGHGVPRLRVPAMPAATGWARRPRASASGLSS
jgi:hypothetical protein